MVKVLKEDLSNYFKFDDKVVFGTVSCGGCRCLEKKYSSSMKEKALKDGFYILGICSKKGEGYSPLINVKYKDADNKHDYVYVIGEYKNGNMHEIITDKKIKFVDEVGVIHFKAPRQLVRFSNNTWQELPLINGREYEPGYYFSDLCYVNCNSIRKKGVMDYLDYFSDKIDIFVGSFNEKLESMKKDVVNEYNNISDAYNRVNDYDYHKKVVNSKILSHKYGIRDM